MKSIIKISGSIFFISLFISSIFLTESYAQEEQSFSVNRDTILSVARDYIDTVRFCALITIDSTGSPHVRTMDPFQPDENMVIWLGTNRKSRKVQEIHNNPHVALYYSDDKNDGYVSIIGTASIIEDKEEKNSHWKNEWDRFYPGKKNYILIKVIPKRLEILNSNLGIASDKETWRTPAIEFNISETID
jgi:general stress protein 26